MHRDIMAALDFKELQNRVRRGWRIWAIRALTVAGASASVAYYTYPPLITWAKALMVAPYAVVFSNRGEGMPQYSPWFHADFRLTDGTVIHKETTLGILRQLPGPYQFKAGYAASLTAAPHRPIQALYGMLQHGFCNGPIAELLQVQSRVREVQLTIPVEETPEGTRAQVMTVRCRQ